MVLSFFICATIILFCACIYLLYKNNNLRDKNNKKDIELAQLKGALKNTKNQEEWIKEQQEIQKQIFQNLSNQTLEKQSKEGSEKIDEILKPFKEKLYEYQQAVDKINGETKTEINTTIKNLLDRTQEIKGSADRLAKAFEGDKKAQGDFGEMLFKNLLKSFSFEENIDYYEHFLLNDEEKRRRYPDFILQVKPDEWLIIDSKFSLVNYERYINEEDKMKKKQFLDSYIEDIKDRIKELSDKEYSKILKQNGKNTLDFVCLFFANEMAYLTAISDSENREEIMNLSRDKKVAIVTPSSFVPVLQMVKYLWKIEKSSKNIEEVTKKIDIFYDKLVKFFKNLNDMHDKVEGALKSYEDAKKYLYDGRQNVTQMVNEIMTSVNGNIKDEKILSNFDKREKEYLNSENENAKDNYDEEDFNKNQN